MSVRLGAVTIAVLYFSVLERGGVAKEGGTTYVNGKYDHLNDHMEEGGDGLRCRAENGEAGQRASMCLPPFSQTAVCSHRWSSEFARILRCTLP